MSDLTPTTREEQYLSAIAGESTVELTPITRKEQYYQKILETIGSGGSGGGGFNPTIVTLDMETMKLSLTPAEIYAKKQAGETVFFNFMGELMHVSIRKDSSGAAIGATTFGSPSPYDDNKMQMSTISFDADGSFVTQNMYSLAVTKEV